MPDIGLSDFGKVTAQGAGWFFDEAGEVIAGLMYVVTEEGQKRTLATGDLAYHQLALAAFVVGEPGWRFDPDAYGVGTDSWVLGPRAGLGSVEIVIDPRDGEGVVPLD